MNTEIQSYDFYFTPEQARIMRAVMGIGNVWTRKSALPVEAGESRRKVIADIDWKRREVVFADSTRCEISVLRSQYDPEFDGRTQLPVVENIRQGGAKTAAIEECEISVRAYNIMKNAGIATVMDLAKRGERSMSRIRGCGKKVLRELEELCDGYDLLRMFKEN